MPAFLQRFAGSVAATLVALPLLAAPASVSEAPASHWAFQPVANPPVPEAVESGWARTSIDRFIQRSLAAAGLSPAPQADRLTLIRRATFDLTGLPPTPDEVTAFLADTAPDAFSRVVDRLLNSHGYGEQWGRHWLDVVRYADTAGETADYPVPVAWRYRNYVINAFNADLPYDEFIRQQIAGDILGRRRPRDQYADSVIATGYLAISRRFGFDSENYHQLTIQDTIDTVGQSVLGLSLGCARCHDHKYDPISASDYYALYGIFDSSRYAFPGSEQKQKYRALVPLRPPNEAQSAWQEFESKIARYVHKLEINQQSIPAGILRSLDELDGDFELQAPAAGGSNGVLVPPWVYTGPIAVSKEAQSPFSNLHPAGKVGVSLVAGTNCYQFGQSLHPRRTSATCDRLYINLDFRSMGSADARGRHRFWVGSQSAIPAMVELANLPPGCPESSRNGLGAALVPESPAFELLIGAQELSLRREDGRWKSLAYYPSNQWRNLQLTLDLKARQLSGGIGSSDGMLPIPPQPLLDQWKGRIDFIGMNSDRSAGPDLPGLEVDNIGVREIPLRPLADPHTEYADVDSEPTLPKLTEEFRRSAGLDGDFELQSDGAALAKPWEPGPKSTVKIAKKSQSPYLNIFPPGTLGIHFAGSSAYDGFGRPLTNSWKATDAAIVHASLDFKTQATGASTGSWRYYLGHGAGASAAVELYLNGHELYRLSGQTRERVTTFESARWYQLQLSLDLQAKHFVGWLLSPSNRVEFQGNFASDWDGTLDYFFIDSYGHLKGQRPELDIDNLAVQAPDLPDLDAPLKPPLVSTPDRLQRPIELQRQIAALGKELDRTREELVSALNRGPFELAYAVVEGTPANARIQLRGNRDTPGQEVPRGFLKVLGGDVLGPDSDGSGRLELAGWLTRRGNPLTARVMVNRVWQYHFGRGLVKTPNDFGYRGRKPTHPELLDHLASRFMESGWSLKALHRLVMNSAVYQQASRSVLPGENSMDTRTAIAASAVAAGMAKDPENDLYWRFNRRRLEAEPLRDAILAVAGELDYTPGEEHPFPAPTSWGFTQHSPFNANYDHHRRSVYLMTQRLKRHPFLALFDGADPNASTPTRSVSTVPTQALYFMNDAFIHENAAHLVERLSGAATTEVERIELAWRLAFGRPPEAIERVEAIAFLAAYKQELGSANSALANTNQSWAALARSLFASNEFLHVD